MRCEVCGKGGEVAGSSRRSSTTRSSLEEGITREKGGGRKDKTIAIKGPTSRRRRKVGQTAQKQGERERGGRVERGKKT